MPSTRLAITTVGLFLISATAARAVEIEDRLAVSVEKRLRGPRGMPGDFLQLNDGTILMSYTKDGAIMGTRSSDKGITWGEPDVLVAAPKPPAFDINEAQARLKPLAAELGESFELTSLYELAKSGELPHVHLSIRSLRESGIIVPAGDGRFVWRD